MIRMRFWGWQTQKKPVSCVSTLGILLLIIITIITTVVITIVIIKTFRAVALMTTRLHHRAGARVWARHGFQAVPLIYDQKDPRLNPKTLSR